MASHLSRCEQTVLNAVQYSLVGVGISFRGEYGTQAGQGGGALVGVSKFCLTPGQTRRSDQGDLCGSSVTI